MPDYERALAFCTATLADSTANEYIFLLRADVNRELGHIGDAISDMSEFLKRLKEPNYYSCGRAAISICETAKLNGHWPTTLN